MNGFDYDVMQKKRIAASAFKRPKHGGCTLPHELMTKKERDAMNGEAITYNVTRPMKWAEYKKLPDDLKREYWRNMQSCGGTARKLVKHMGASEQSICKAARTIGTPFKRGAPTLDGHWNEAERRWAGANAPEGTQERTEGTGECSNTPPDEKPAETLKTPITLVHAKLVLNGERENVLQHLRLLMPESGEVTVEW